MARLWGSLPARSVGPHQCGKTLERTGAQMLFAHCDEPDAALADALHVSENLNGRVVIPHCDKAMGTVVVMHHDTCRQMPSVSYDHTDDGDLRLCLPEGEGVLLGVRDPSQVCMVLRGH